MKHLICTTHLFLDVTTGNVWARDRIGRNWHLYWGNIDARADYQELPATLKSQWRELRDARYKLLARLEAERG
jgi:hypothetical protein